MTQEEQLEQIRYPTFFKAAGEHINQANTALEAARVTALEGGWYRTDLNEIQIDWHTTPGEDSDTHMRIGIADAGGPLYQLSVPTPWLGQ